MNLENEDIIFEIEQPRFDRNRFRVYYGNIGKIIAQEVLRKQGFEVWLANQLLRRKSFLAFSVFRKLD